MTCRTEGGRDKDGRLMWTEGLTVARAGSEWRTRLYKEKQKEQRY